MFFTGIGCAVPEKGYRKSECWEAYEGSAWFQRLNTRSHAIVRSVLALNNGIEQRHLAVDTLEEVFQIDPDTLYRRFLKHAPLLASQAAQRALDRAGLRSEQIDAIVVSTCTGYLCPGLSGYVVEMLGMRDNVRAFDLVGQGCAAALPNMRMAKALLDSDDCEHVLSVCVEVCSAAMYLDDDPGVLISACLFGDGAGAAVLSRRPNSAVRRIEWKDSESLIVPELRDALKFEQRDGMLRNILTKDVPAIASRYAAEVLQTVLARSAIRQDAIKGWIMHAGGRDVLLALEKKLRVASNDFRYSASTLRQYGNLSSAFVYFVFEAALADQAPGGAWWMSSFGAGFSCHGALLTVE
ncbi:MAG: 3-oxoacyl-[acyl-carrier-protein] synthase III C-terminal domain-containing protein [bacterium]